MVKCILFSLFIDDLSLLKLTSSHIKWRMCNCPKYKLIFSRIQDAPTWYGNQRFSKILSGNFAQNIWLSLPISPFADATNSL